MPPVVNLGPFAPMFERGDLDVVAYLVLLNLGSPDEVRVALRRLRTAVDSPELTPSIFHQLMSSRDWRRHLVGAVTSLMVQDAGPFIPMVWDAFDAGSWVAPQLCATLSLVDPAFVEGARGRLLGETPYAKAIASLVGILGLHHEAAPWIGDAEARPDVRHRLEADRVWDDSGRIALRWRAAILRFAKLEDQLFEGRLLE